MQFDPLWKGLTVIFSDSNVPGEGEHKILEFIRKQRRIIKYIYYYRARSLRSEYQALHIWGGC